MLAKKNDIRDLLLAAAFFCSLFLIAVAVWYSPILFKGHPASFNGSNALITKNLNEVGKFSIANDKHVILNSHRIEGEGVTSSEGQKLLPLLNAKVYKAFGVTTENEIILVAIMVSALSLVFFTATVWRMFGRKQAFIFAVLYIFFPTNWNTSITAGSYELALLFLSLGIFVYFGSVFNKNTTLRAILFGILIALSALSRTAMVLFIVPAVLWVWLYDRNILLSLISAFAATIVIFMVAFHYHYGASANHHLALIGIESSEHKDFSHLGHLYPDPYTYHFKRDEFLQQTREKIAVDGIAVQGIAKEYKNIEGGELSLIQRLTLMQNLTAQHLMRFISLQDVGGILIFLILLLGGRELYILNRKFALFLFAWILSFFALLIAVVLVQRNHIMDFAFAYVLLVSFGITSLASMIKNEFSLGSRKYFSHVIVTVLTLSVAYQMLLSTHVVFSYSWDNGTFRRVVTYANSLEEAKLAPENVVAAPLRMNEITHITYLSDTSMVLFQEETVQDLARADKLEDAFKEFGVTNILGYSASTTELALRSSSVEVVQIDETQSSQDYVKWKSFLMNLIR